MAIALTTFGQDLSKHSISIGGNFQPRDSSNALMGAELNYTIGGKDVWGILSIKTSDNNVFLEGGLVTRIFNIEEFAKIAATLSGGLLLNQGGNNPGFIAIGASGAYKLNDKWEAFIYAKEVFFTVKGQLLTGVGLGYKIN